MLNLFTKSIKSDASFFNKFDGINKKVNLYGATYELITDKNTTAPYEERIKYFLESEGDVNLITITFLEKSLFGVSSSRRSLKDSAKQFLKETCNIKNISSVRNLEDNGTVIRLPLLINGQSATLLGAKYSYVKSHSELFPQIDLTFIENAKSYADRVLASLSDEDFAIIIEDFQRPGNNKVYNFSSSDLCYSNFMRICIDHEHISESLPFTIKYPKGRDVYSEELEEGHFERGNVLTVWANDQLLSRYTMQNIEYN